MVFSSLVFVFGFLSLCMLIYTFVPKQYKNTVLLVSSLLFYAWGGVQYLFLLLGEVAISWFCALQIEKHRKTRMARLFMILECVSLLGLLAIFKYLGFFSQIVYSVFNLGQSPVSIILPIGISFYTFQLLSYVIDVYKGEVAAQKSYPKLLLYASLFHQCIAGPIVRYKTVAKEIDNRTVSMQDIFEGISRFASGLAKKAILANGCAAVADALLVDGQVEGLSLAAYWLGMFAYMLQIYLDFSAYSDMAIGMGRMVGFHYLENFNYPYQAVSVQDFWRRWHISLSTFFRDYVYIPLGGNRGGVWIYIRNMIVVWFLTGMWHGASWNYILWGLYYLVFLLLEKFVIKQRIPNGWNRLYTLSVVFFGWTIFRFENLSDLVTVLKGLFGIGISSLGSASVWTLFLGNILLLAVSVFACTNLTIVCKDRIIEYAKKSPFLYGAWCTFEALLPTFLLVLSVFALAGNSYNPFLYFQF
jgi:alginate O-acetyltransferase complex protein AlgI